MDMKKHEVALLIVLLVFVSFMSFGIGRWQEQTTGIYCVSRTADCYVGCETYDNDMELYSRWLNDCRYLLNEGDINGSLYKCINDLQRCNDTLAHVHEITGGLNNRGGS